jgi:hypothetical protein
MHHRDTLRCRRPQCDARRRPAFLIGEKLVQTAAT